MGERNKTISEINEKLKKGEAIVLTAKEIKDAVRSGTKIKAEEVDVVTTATRATMSGVAAMFVFHVAKRGVFVKGKHVWVNGVPGFIGPAPNQRQGVIDVMIYGTAHSIYDPENYGGGHLFRDIVERKEIYVEGISDEGITFETHTNLENMEFTRIYTFRSCFKNYNAYANIKNLPFYRDNPKSGYAFRPNPLKMGLQVGGSGELNPVQNDPKLRTIKVGSKILVNGAKGIVINSGTRSFTDKPALSVAANMDEMKPELMGGFRTTLGPEIVTTIAIPIPILNQEILDAICEARDENIIVPVDDIGDREVVGEIRYSEVFGPEAPLEFEHDPDKCMTCSFACPVEFYCPMKAFSRTKKEIDQDKCFHCGACVVNCLAGAFKKRHGDYIQHLGTPFVKSLGIHLPILWRQSDRLRAQAETEYLKALMLKGEFMLIDTDFDMQQSRKIAAVGL